MADTLDDGSLPDTETEVPGAVPWHLWAVGAVGVLLNGYPALDFTLTMLQVPAWLAMTPQNVREALENAPVWATAAWAIGGWSAFIGSILLLLRSARAPRAFALSLAAAIVSFSWQYSVGITPLVFALVILTLIAFFWWYAARMRDEGVLR